MNKKDKKIIKDSEKAGIPVFILTAKDKLSLDAIQYYKSRCRGENCPDEHVEGVEARANEFAKWQYRNPKSVKLPD